MQLRACRGCELPVLEIAGQFEMLDAYFIVDGRPPPETAGRWHSVCIVTSPHGPAWYEARLANYREQRGYETVAETASWTVIRRPGGGALAFRRAGSLLPLADLGSKKKSRYVPGGRVFPRIDEGYNLDVKDASVVTAIRDGFAADGSVPLLRVFELLGIRERICQPEALESAQVTGVRDTDSKHFITMRLEYGVFVPDELLPYTGAAKP